MRPQERRNRERPQDLEPRPRAHPRHFISPGSVIDQSSSIAGAANVACGLYACQMPGKPYAVTAFGHVFWKRHRCEQAFVTSAATGP